MNRYYTYRTLSYSGPKSLILLILSLTLYTGCVPLPHRPLPPSDINLVVLGGKDLSGNILDDVVYYQLKSFGDLSEAGTGKRLDEPRYSAVAVAQQGTVTVLGGYDSTDTNPSGTVFYQHNEHLYLIGGRDSEGNYMHCILTRTIDDEEWRETTPLPVGLAFPSVFSIGSTLFVLGGEHHEGESNTIIHTKIHANGDLGYTGAPWITNSIDLPYPISQAASVVHEGRIFLIGGKTPHGLSNKIMHARISPNVSVGQWYISPKTLPKPITLACATVVYTQTNDFSITQQDVSIEGPGHYRMPGGLCALLQNDREITYIPFPSLEPQVPQVFPGTGVVGKNASIRYIHDPNATVEYSSNQVSWKPADNLNITDEGTYWFRSIWKETYSSAIPIEFRLRPQNFVVFIEGSISINKVEEDAYHEIDLKSNSQWWTCSPPERLITLDILDASNSENHSAEILITLMEGDVHTEVLDIHNNPISSKPAKDFPIQLLLQRGTYMIHVEELSENSLGKTVGIRIRETE